LIEKQITTPEYYPLTLNSLTLACNQKNNRNPVSALTEAEVEQALDSLREKNLAYVFYGSTSRVPKYKHVADNLHLSPLELSVICVLMLSGAQTVGEIRGRAYRLYESSGLEEIEQALDSLAAKDEPLVVKLPRLAGQKEAEVRAPAGGRSTRSKNSTASNPSANSRANLPTPSELLVSNIGSKHWRVKLKACACSSNNSRNNLSRPRLKLFPGKKGNQPHEKNRNLCDVRFDTPGVALFLHARSQRFRRPQD